ncbi:MAG: peptide-methionine (S)-S-oxide reductase MsrA [Porphyromonas sp.]|nr:peptide-methionine (S)-S-oxide reductase MsrA [Porphyromonas sp.]
MTQTIYLAAGCFWGVQFHLSKLAGVTATCVGYMGGYTKNPTYEDVCRGNTGHYETVKVEYDDTQISTDEVLKLYFEIHDFEQANGQGPDLGMQYLSNIFYTQEAQRDAAIALIKDLNHRGYKVRTEVAPAPTFWPGEIYHQDYYEKKGGQPYCHSRRKIF